MGGKKEILFSWWHFKSATSLITVKSNSNQNDNIGVNDFFFYFMLFSGELKVDKHRSLNKIGHALYELDPEFKRVTYKKKIHVSCLVLGRW